MSTTATKSVTSDFEHLQDKVHSIRFNETPEGSAPVNIGSLYVQKHTLANLGYEPGDKVRVTLEVVKK